ncbi:MAG: hypothetical protein AAGG45_06705, partial [Pseudomonadota bacterium]
MRRTSFFILAAIVMSGCGAVEKSSTDQSDEGQSAEACISDREALLSLDYMAFELDPTQGYQPVLAQSGCELVAADLIRDYHAKLRDRGEPVIISVPQGEIPVSGTGAVTLLYWHEGQIRASQGQTQEALGLFEKSLEAPEDSRRGWNEYVRGSIAFLESDLSELKRQRGLMSTTSKPSELNLSVL